MNVASGFSRSCASSRLSRVGLAVGLVALLAAPALARENCKSSEGDFTSGVVPNPAGSVLATHGTLTGDLEASYDFVMTSLLPDPLDPTTLYYEGYSVVTLNQNGHQLFTEDTGVMHIQPNGTATFVTTAMIVGGTKNFKNATGEFVAPGLLNLTTGQAVGTYSATVCKHDD